MQLNHNIQSFIGPNEDRICVRNYSGYLEIDFSTPALFPLSFFENFKR